MLPSLTRGWTNSKGQLKDVMIWGWRLPWFDASNVGTTLSHSAIQRSTTQRQGVEKTSPGRYLFIDPCCQETYFPRSGQLGQKYVHDATASELLTFWGREPER